MKNSLQLRLSQHLALTPQLQQSIRLLQLSTLELNQELERFLMDNPLLERAEGWNEDTQPQPVVNHDGNSASVSHSSDGDGDSDARSGATTDAADAAPVGENWDAAGYPRSSPRHVPIADCPSGTVQVPD